MAKAQIACLFSLSSGLVVRDIGVKALCTSA